jgi:hypothetical protein
MRLVKLILLYLALLVLFVMAASPLDAPTVTSKVHFEYEQY